MDVKKHVEELAKQAGINAKGARPCCMCSTYQEATQHAEELIEDLARGYCPDYTFAVLMIAASRYKSVIERNVGTLPMIAFIAEMADQSNDLGTPLLELQNKVADWHDENNPHKGAPI